MTEAVEEKQIHNISLFYVDKPEGEESKGVEDGSIDEIIKQRKSFILEGILFVNEDTSKKLPAKVMLVPVESSNISHIGYQIANANNGCLYVLFSNRSCYIYYNVPWTTALDFNDSESLGRYLAANIKKGQAFACDKII
jgi:hypothetical protein